ncbi:synaptonemal complex protein 2 [Amia ocellicauda]|uniref:synaptonemal complex protein 2 n=1 Tax=Amia ocellicauda TaxID=2972642 RepID=UPI003464C9A0
MPLKKSGAKKPGRRAVKKHLFSDTEPDSRPEDSCTNISWLRDSSRRPKPKVADYSRRRAGKPTPNPDSHVSPDLSSPLPKPSKKKASSTKKRERKQTSPKEQRATTSGRPKRTAAQKQTYKDPSGSDSSENSLDEELPLRKPKQVQPNSKEEETVGAPPPVEKRSRGQKNPAADTWASDFSPPASPPPTVEKMRCAEMKSVVSPRSPVSALCNLSVSFTDSPSPPPQLLEPLQGILSQSFYKADQKSLKAPFLLSLSPVTKLSNLAIHEHDKASPALTLISEVRLTY